MAIVPQRTRPFMVLAPSGGVQGRPAVFTSASFPSRGEPVQRSPAAESPRLYGLASLSYNPDMVAANLETESEILARVLAPENPDLSQEAAESLLKLRFAPRDTERMNELAAKAREGGMSPDEDRLLQGYLFVGSLVDLLHSKARLSLKGKHGGNGA